MTAKWIATWENVCSTTHQNATKRLKLSLQVAMVVILFDVCVSERFVYIIGYVLFYQGSGETVVRCF